MAKGTWVNVGGNWKNVKNIWVNINGVWKQKAIPKGNVAGVWKEFVQYNHLIYGSGVVYERLEQFLTSPVPIYNVDSISLSGNVVTNTLITSNLVDLTDYKTAYIEWEFSTTHGENAAVFQIRDSKQSGGPLAQYYQKGSLARRINSIDVSNITGNHYVLFGYNANYSATMNMKIYKVWLE